MANKLNIYACSGLDKKPDTKGYNWWSDGSYDAMACTQAVNGLLVKINLLRSELQNLRGLSYEQKVVKINEINFYCVCLYFVRQYQQDKEELEKIGKAIEAVGITGAFEKPDASIATSDTDVMQLIESVNDRLNAAELEWNGNNKDFKEWWKKNIIDRSKIGLSEEKRKKVREVLARREKGVNAVNQDWRKDANIAEYLTKGSEYFLYLYFTNEQLAKLPHIFGFKRTRQVATYNYCKTLFTNVYGTEQDMKDIIRAGIVGYFGAQPEDVCDAISGGKEIKSIGDGGASTVVFTAAEIVSIVAAVLTFVGGVIGAICQMVADSKVAEYQSIDQAAINASTPNPEDFEGINFDKEINGKSGRSILAYAAIAAGIYLIFKGI